VKKLYVVRGLGAWDGNVWASTHFDVTFLEQSKVVSKPGSWRSQDPTGQSMCYNGFQNLTGVCLKPGEYTTIECKECD
jgi:hypothetical protein